MPPKLWRRMAEGEAAQQYARTQFWGGMLLGLLLGLGLSSLVWIVFALTVVAR